MAHSKEPSGKWIIRVHPRRKKKRGTQALRNTTCFQDNLRSLDSICMTDSKSPLFLWRHLLIYSNWALRFILHINLEANLS